jgi:flagellar biosynthesis/type III secretory pathway chaperone
MSKINDILQKKLDIYEQLLTLINDEMLSLSDKKNKHNELQRVTNGEINMVDEIYVLDGGNIDMIYEKPTLEKIARRLHAMKDTFSMDLSFAMESSFSRIKRNI